MTTVTWAQLTPDEQATLNYFCENGVPVGVHVSRLPACYNTLSDYGLMTFTQTGEAVMVDVTAAGLAVWQQGQVASAPPRSVWVAMWHEYGEGDYLLSIHAQHETAQTACEVHAEQALKWEYAAGFDGMGEYRARVYDDDVLQGEYFVHEMPVLP